MWWQQSRTSGRNATPTVAILDSQSAQAAQRGASIDPQGDDAGKKVSGRKRHILRVGSGPSAWSLQRSASRQALACCWKAGMPRDARVSAYLSVFPGPPPTSWL